MTIITIKQINLNFVNEFKPLKTKAYTTNGARIVYIYIFFNLRNNYFLEKKVETFVVMLLLISFGVNNCVGRLVLHELKNKQFNAFLSVT